MGGNWGIFVSLRSWVKYAGNMERVGNVGEEWESVLGCGKVWKNVVGPTHPYTLSPHPPHLPDTSSHTAQDLSPKPPTLT